MASKGKQKKKKGRILITLLIVLIGAGLLCLMAIFLLYEIQNLNVIGNRVLPKEEIIAQSGVKVGDNYFFLNRSKLKERLEKNRYIEFRGTQFDYSGTMNIKINERHAMGIIQRNGLYYVIDADGMVLENSQEVMPDFQCPIVKGLDLSSRTLIIEGQIIGVKDIEQLSALSAVLKALDDTNMQGRTVSLDVSNLDNISIMTTEGAGIVLGRATDAELKLIIAREILASREDKKELMGANIDVSSGEKAYFMPPVLPTVTPVPTTTPTPAPSATPKK